MILFVNACVREASRTKRLADCLLARLGGEVNELRLEDVAFPVADEAFLKKRDALIAAERFDDPLFDMARDFAAADIIVIAAPYWDLSSPPPSNNISNRSTRWASPSSTRRRAIPGDSAGPGS